MKITLDNQEIVCYTASIETKGENIMENNGKEYTVFTINQGDINHTALCEVVNTRSGFNHVCTIISGKDFTKIKHTVKYSNRTWEAYRFQMVLAGAMRKAGFTMDEVRDAVDIGGRNAVFAGKLKR